MSYILETADSDYNLSFKFNNHRIKNKIILWNLDLDLKIVYTGLALLIKNIWILD